MENGARYKCKTVMGTVFTGEERLPLSFHAGNYSICFAETQKSDSMSLVSLMKSSKCAKRQDALLEKGVPSDNVAPRTHNRSA